MATNWQWLDDLTREEVENNPLPFKQLLEDSVYYPASGTDGEPVRHLNKLSRSFIYVDYNYSLERLHQEMIVHGFKGYEIFVERQVTEQEITPHNFNPHDVPNAKDGDPRKPEHQGWIHHPSYAYWTIWQRLEGFDEEHGPKRFSLFNLCADGVASFDALYYAWQTKPLVFCIIHSDGFSLNWTQFRKPGLIMHRLAMNNPSGKPEYMLVDEKRGYWPEYPKRLQVFNRLHLYH